MSGWEIAGVIVFAILLNLVIISNVYPRLDKRAKNPDSGFADFLTLFKEENRDLVVAWLAILWVIPLVVVLGWLVYKTLVAISEVYVGNGSNNMFGQLPPMPPPSKDPKKE